MKTRRLSILCSLVICHALMTSVSAQSTPTSGKVSLRDTQPSSPTKTEPAQVEKSAVNSGKVKLTAAEETPQHQAEPEHVGQYIFGPSGVAATKPFGTRGYADVYINSGRGYEDGFTNLGLFVPFHVEPNYSLFFFDGRAIVTHDGETGANLTFGYRAFNPDWNRITTVAGGWDLDNGHRADSYQQAFVSLSSLGKYFDAHFNAYLPFGTTSNTLDDSVIWNPYFEGNNIMVTRQTTIESAYRGMEVEFGGPMPLVGRYGVKGYLGGYYLDATADRAATGVSFRLNTTVSQDVSFDVTYTDDRVFGNNVAFNLVMNMPDGRPQNWFRPKKVQNRLDEAVERNYRVLTHVQQRRQGVQALDPDDDTPYRVAHIDPHSSGDNDGTYEDPFLTLADYNALTEVERRAFDIIFVSDGTIVGNIMPALDDGIVLYNDQRLLSEAPLTFLPSGLPVAATAPAAGFHTFDYTVAFDPTFLDEDVVLPGMNASATRPILSNVLGGNVVTLAGNETEVSGFIIDGTTEAYVTNNSDGIITDTTPGLSTRGFTITYNQFRNTVNSAVINNNGHSEGTFVGNELIGMGNDGDKSSNKGFALTHTNISTLRLNIQDNIATGYLGEDANNSGDEDAGEDLDGNGTFDIGVGFSITANDASLINYLYEDYDDDGNLIGTYVQPFPFINNTSSGNGTGVLINVDNGSIDVNMQGNLIENNVAISQTDDHLGTSFGSGLRSVANDGRIDYYSLANNIIQGNAGNGVELLAMNGGRITSLISEDLDNDGVIDPAEDFNLNGILDADEDLNGNGVLDPGEDVNLNGILDVDEDANGNLELDDGEDLNGNGLLDTDEDLNGNGVLDPSEDINGNMVLDLGITGNTIINNGNNGFVAETNDGAITDLYIGSPDENLPDDTVLGVVGTPDNIITGNGTVTGTGRGILLRTLVAEVDANMDGLPDFGEDLNENGLLDLGGGLITGMIINNALDDQLNSSLNNNAGSNVLLSASGGTASLGAITLDGIYNNNMTESGDAGLEFYTEADSSITMTDGIRNNDFSNNTAESMLVTANTGSVALGEVSDNTFDRETAGTHGVSIVATQAGISGDFVRNSFVANTAANANVGTGFWLQAIGGVSGQQDIDLSIGSPTVADGNIFTDNVDVAVGIDIRGDMATPMLATVDVLNNVITGTTDGALPRFTGDAIRILVDGGVNALPGIPGPQDNAILENSSISGNLLGDETDTTLANAGAAIAVNLSGFGTIRDMLIEDNLIYDSGVDGIQFRRVDAGALDAVSQTYAIVINNNLIERSAGDGIDLTADGGRFYTDNFTVNDQDFLLQDNVIRNSTGYGVLLNAQSDAYIVADLTDNLIELNGSGGVYTNLDIVSLTLDDPGISGTWTGNVIRSNDGHGIHLNGSTGIFLGDGTEGGRNYIGGYEDDGVTPAGNQGDGIFISNFDNYLYADTNTIANNRDTGVDINTGSAQGADVYLLNNEITGHGLDGVEALASGDGGGNYSNGVTLVLDGNNISGNAGRGVDLLNRANSTMDVIVDNNTIQGNGEEGVFVVNTSSTTQTQDFQSTGGANPGLLANGAVNRTPYFNIRLRDNSIVGNGQVIQTNNAGGLVFWVGTADAIDSESLLGIAPTLAQQLDRAKVTAEITGNLFAGNWGDDIFIESFVSTNDPATTNGTWDQNNFTLNNLVRDPLARMDIVRFRNNYGDSLALDGSTLNAPAFYNNAEGTFKSRLNTANPAGPFTSATRRRNATRLATREGAYNTPAGPGNGGIFVYDGVGDSFQDSAFRVENAADDSAAFFTNNGFGFNAVKGYNNAIVGELPFYWDDTLTPGYVFGP